jgi:hypothetical protein
MDKCILPLGFAVAEDPVDYKNNAAPAVLGVILALLGYYHLYEAEVCKLRASENNQPGPKVFSLPIIAEPQDHPGKAE